MQRSLISLHKGSRERGADETHPRHHPLNSTPAQICLPTTGEPASDLFNDVISMIDRHTLKHPPQPYLLLFTLLIPSPSRTPAFLAQGLRTTHHLFSVQSSLDPASLSHWERKPNAAQHTQAADTQNCGWDSAGDSLPQCFSEVPDCQHKASCHSGDSK